MVRHPSQHAMLPMSEAEEAAMVATLNACMYKLLFLRKEQKINRQTHIKKFEILYFSDNVSKIKMIQIFFCPEKGTTGDNSTVIPRFWRYFGPSKTSLKSRLDMTNI